MLEPWKRECSEDACRHIAGRNEPKTHCVYAFIRHTWRKARSGGRADPSVQWPFMKMSFCQRRKNDHRALIDDVVATVHIESFAGDQSCGVVCKKCGCNADVVDADKAAGRGLALGLLEQVIEFGNSGSGSRGQRTGGDRVNPDPF